LGQELEEVGAHWHSRRWSTHMILDDNPWEKKQAPSFEEIVRDLPNDENREFWAWLPIERNPSGKPEKWKWLEPMPKDWKPAVKIEKDKITVTFYTISLLGREKIYRFTDTYKPGSYHYETKQEAIAEGFGGMVF
jgi:hypothetical protein